MILFVGQGHCYGQKVHSIVYKYLFQTFANLLNTHRQSIEFEFEHSVLIPKKFLDYISYEGYQQFFFLDFRVYFKETGTHSLLFESSHHPKHTGTQGNHQISY